MDKVSSTHLKNRLGEVLARAAVGRVAIERHGRVVAYLVPAFEGEGERDRTLARRSAAAKPFGRAEEERLLELCARGDFRPSRWRRAGDPALLAGVAALLASVDLFDRTRLFALAEQLQPGTSSVEGLGRWLAASPVKPARFLPLLRARMKRRRAK
jgi:prevent-host-death family protein